MVNANEPEFITAKILIYPGTESPEDTRGFVVLAFKRACQRVRGDSSVAIALYDSNGKFLGSDISGEPGDKLKAQIEEIFYESASSR